MNNTQSGKKGKQALPRRVTKRANDAVTVQVEDAAFAY
jgi:hypothetical protein